MNNIPFISIIIPCRNEEQFIRKCIDSIISQDYPKSKLEVIVVDGMSDDRTRELLKMYMKEHAFVRLLHNPQKIVSTALNIGIKNARGEIIVRMDVHTEYAPDYISQCFQILKQTGADNVGGAARTKAYTYIQKAISIAYKSPFGVGGAKFHDKNFEGYVDTITYGCWKKLTLEKIGLFDEELVRNQDDELNLRLIRSGGKIWQSPAIKSWYYPRDSIVTLFKQYVQYGYWKVRVIQKHKMPASIRHIVPGAFVGLLAIITVLSPFSQLYLKTLVILLACYILTNSVASFLACKESSNWKYITVMPIVFAAYHFGYGYGFLRGILNFAILKKQDLKTFTKLTRITRNRKEKIR
ncbi:glycosyltransferase family 2 protein [Desulfobacula toluolica]|uniref:Glycosyl transferase, family 2 n=1 Tax=Desulfobacula toluolica (strain DSM 7467 / Tol2) TaxID=651182 RepID=K0NGL4_DESTT|nr:glycosyltransferase family 2 protein [Desulfobacula toluolica]CCK78978.1 glycosyl transferase, family 2 [Desulfobacula toluolica Tol2]